MWTPLMRGLRAVVYETRNIILMAMSIRTRAYLYTLLSIGIFLNAGLMYFVGF